MSLLTNLLQTLFPYKPCKIIKVILQKNPIEPGSRVIYPKYSILFLDSKGKEFTWKVDYAFGGFSEYSTYNKREALAYVNQHLKEEGLSLEDFEYRIIENNPIVSDLQSVKPTRINN